MRRLLPFAIAIAVLVALGVTSPFGLTVNPLKLSAVNATAPAPSPDKLVAVGTSTNPRQMTTLVPPASSWTSPTSVPGITSSNPRIYALTDRLWFATNDSDDASAWGWGVGARSKDGGVTWSSTPDPGVGGGGIMYVARDLGGRVWAIVQDSDSTYTRTSIYYSDNDGDSWTLSTTSGSGSSPQQSQGWKILTHPTNPNVIAIVGFSANLPTLGYGSGYILSSTDRGASWTVHYSDGIRQGQYGVRWTYDATMLPSGRIVAQGPFITQAPIHWYTRYTDDFGSTWNTPVDVTNSYSYLNGLFASADGSRVAYLYTLNTSVSPIQHRLVLSTDGGTTFNQVSLPQELESFVGSDFTFSTFASSTEADALYVRTGKTKNIVKLSPVDASGTWTDLTDSYSFTSQGNDNLAVIADQPARPPNAFGSCQVSNPNVPCSNEPINLAIGNYTYQHTDAFVPGKGYPLAFSRSYNSQYGSNGRLGFGWQDNLRARLSFDNSDHSIANVTLIREDGRQDDYKRQSDGSYTAPTGVFDTLTRNGGDGTFQVVTTPQLKMRFDSNGVLQWLQDRNANQTTLAYSGSHLASVTDPGGRTLTFGYDTSDRITSVTDPLNRVTTYGYDGSGNLSTVTEPGSFVTTFTYDGNHQLLTIIDPLQHTIVTNVYTSGKVTQQTNALNQVWTFGYSAGATTEIDPRSCTTTHYYDSRYRETERIDCLTNAITTFGYDGLGDRISTRDPLGHLSTATFDGHGNLTSITDPLGTTSTFTYNGFNDVLVQTDSLGRQTQYVYNTSGNLTSVVDAGSNTTSFTPNGDGTLASITDPLNHSTSFAYDQYGNRTTITDPLTHATTFVFDLGGRATSATDALQHATTYTYDDRNNLTTVKDSLNDTTTYSYDAKGRLTGVTDANNKVTSYAYDNANHLTSETDALNQVTSYAYDSQGNRTTVTNPKTKVTTYTYDVLRRLTTVNDPLNRTSTYAYDAANRRTSRTDAKNQTTNYTYDAGDRLTGVTYPSGTPNVTFTYDTLGDRLTMVDGTGTTTYAYDNLYRLTSVTDGAGNIVSYAYDSAGRKTGITYPGGTNSVSYGYDSANRLTTATDWLNKTTSYQYDNANRLTLTTLGNGLTAARTYDNADRLNSVVNKNGATTLSSYTYALDPVGNRSQMTDLSGVTTYTYDSLYRLTQVAYPDPRTDTYTYDAQGNRLTRNAETYTYDDADQLTSQYTADTDGDGCTDFEEFAGAHHSSAAQPPGATGAYHPNSPSGWSDFFDVPVPALTTSNPNGTKNRAVSLADELAIQWYIGTSAANPNTANANGAKYGTDLNGNGIPDGQEYDRSSSPAPSPPWDAGAPNGAVSLQDMLIAQNQVGLLCTQNAGSTSNTYDANGNETGRGADTFSYDAENRLTSSTVDGVTTTSAYNGDGLRISRTAGSSTITYVWDVNRSVPQILKDSGGYRNVYGQSRISRTDGSGNQEYYLQDGLGSTTAVADGTGPVTTSYIYDVFGALRSKTGSSTNEFTFAGDQVDANGLEYLRARYYDRTTGRFTSQDPIRFLNRYAYGLNNPTNRHDPLGLDPSDDGSSCGWFSSVCDFGSAVKDKAAHVAEDTRDFADSCLSSLGHAAADVYRASPIIVGGVAAAGTATVFIGGIVVTSPESEGGGVVAVIFAAGASVELGYAAGQAALYTEDHPYTDDPLGAAHDLFTDDLHDIRERCGSRGG